MDTETPVILVIVGITGDLAKRMILPAIGRIAAAGTLPHHFHILGVTRQKNVSIDHLLARVENKEFVTEHLQIFQMDLDSPKEYHRLKTELEKIEKKFGRGAQRLFYLSVPPHVSETIIKYHGASGLAKVEKTKLLLEKPFGIDMATATDLVGEIEKYFSNEQVYRIDHYVAKGMAQNIIVFREENSLFRRTWNKEFIERIEIIASESIGIEGRIGFYEQAGALRDYVQNHLLQLAALTLMEIPPSGSMMEDVSVRRLAALKDLYFPTDAPLQKYVRRGQYRGYTQEVDNPKSTVETFTAVTLFSKNSRWKGVPIVLVAGKMLEKKMTEVRIFYKKDQETESNELVLRLYPDEGVLIRVWAKRPGYQKDVEKHILRFTYADHYKVLPEAYEQVLLDSIRSDQSRFTSSAEVLESWRILAPVQEAWKRGSDDLFLYEPGASVAEILTQE